MSRDADPAILEIVSRALDHEPGPKSESPEARRQVFVGSPDLDGDGNAELVAYVESPDECGSRGCPLVVLRRDSAGKWSIVLEALSPNARICLDAGQHLGFHDLALGGVPRWRSFVWRGDRYVESQER